MLDGLDAGLLLQHKKRELLAAYSKRAKTHPRRLASYSIVHVAELIFKHGAAMYINGHDHNVQLVATPSSL